MSKRKVKLPLDHNGVPINIDDWLMFDDGPFHVDVLNYYGKGVVAAVGCCWTAEDENGNICDNLSAGCVVGRRDA